MHFPVYELKKNNEIVFLYCDSVKKLTRYTSWIVIWSHYECLFNLVVS